ncbi:MAG: hypothetical protein RSC69_06515 [Lachnospiraceae bacterium]
MKKKNQLKKITAMLLTMFLVLPTMQVRQQKHLLLRRLLRLYR